MAEEYKPLGLLVGFSVYSGVILDMPLPLVVFRKVWGQRLSMEVKSVGVCSIAVCLSNLTIDHASVSGRNTVPTPRDTSNILVLTAFLP